MTGATAEQWLALHDLDGRLDDHASLEARMRMVDGILHGARQLLAEDAYGRYRAILNRDVAGLLLGAPADSPGERGY